MKEQTTIDEQTPLVLEDQEEEQDDPQHAQLSWLKQQAVNVGSSLRSFSTSSYYSSRRRYNSVRSSTEIQHEQRKQALLHPGVGPAAFLIRDAVLGEVENPAPGAYDPYLDPSKRIRNNVSMWCRRICTQRPLLKLLQTTSWVLVLLTFIEPPHWCRSGLDHQYNTGGYTGCLAYLDAKGLPADGSTDQPVQLYPNSKSMLVSVGLANAIETACVAFIALFVLLRFGRDGMSLATYLRRGPSRRIRVIQLICLGLLMGGLAWHYHAHRPLIRLVLLGSFLPGVQRDLLVLVHMTPEIVRVLTLLIVFMIFYAWFGVVMFLDTPEAVYFSSLVEALWTLYICVTTANYPDVMMPAYNQNRWVALYFVSFMVLSFFFLMNVILAAVVNEYERAVQKRRQERSRAAKENLLQAYQLLDPYNSGRITRQTVMSLFRILNEDFPEFRTLSEEDTNLLFAVLDRDGSSTISPDEFMEIGNVMLLEFTPTSTYDTFVEVHFPDFAKKPAYQAFCRTVKSNLFEYTIDCILVLNAVVIGIQTYPELSGGAVELDPKYWDGSVDTVWELMETIFTIVYVLEMMVKITAMGWKAYSENPKNVFDFTITVLAVASSLYVYWPNEFSDSRLIRLIVMARVLRLIRLLLAMRQFQLIGRISAEILPLAASVVLVLFFLMYSFAVLGTELYGGLITRDPENPLSYLILNTDFSDNDYWANNFNDMVSAMNVLFNLLVVNNWTECEVGFEAVTQAKWVRFFFLGFHLLGVVLVNNLVIAFIISSFLAEWRIFQERTGAEVIGEGEAVIHNRRAMFDASTVTGTKTALKGGYIARLRKTASDIEDGGDHHERLKELFTRTSSEMGRGSSER